MGIVDEELLRSKKGNLEVLPLQAEDVDTGKPVALKSKNGALQVDLCEIENVQIVLPEGTALDVEVQNTAPIPVDLPAEKVVDVEVQNTAPIPVDLPAEKVVDVEVQNTDPIPVSLPEGDLGVTVNNEDPLSVAFETPQEIAVPDGVSLPVTVGNTEPIPVDLPAEKIVAVAVTNETAIPVSLPEGNVGVEVNNGSAIPVSLPEGNVGVEVNNAASIPVEVEFRSPIGQTVQIEDTESSSASFEIAGIEAFGLGVPYGTEGASLGIWVSIDDTNWFLLPEVLPFVADQAGVNYACNTAGVGLMELLAPWGYCKLQTLDSEGDAQVQASDRDFVVVTR